MKPCRVCESLLISNDNWSKGNESKKDYICKSCKKIYDLEYRIKNKKLLSKKRKLYRKNNLETVRDYNRNWRLGNKDLTAKYNKEYYIKNKTKLKEDSKLYYQDNKQFYKEYNAKWRLQYKDTQKVGAKLWQTNNPKKVAIASRKWQRLNRGKMCSYAAKRRALKIKATPKWANIDKIRTIYEKAKWLETITGLVYEVDHVIPLQGVDVCGLHVWGNLQILEKSLNRKKSNKTKGVKL